MSVRTTLASRLRQATLRAQLTALYAGLLVVVVSRGACLGAAGR